MASLTDFYQPPSPDRLVGLLDEGTHEGTEVCLDRLATAETDDRKRASRAVRSIAEKRLNVFEEITGALSTFLTDENRAVRLTTAKLFVALSQSEPAAVLPFVDALADRLADDEEFYYVRARCAEALGVLAQSDATDAVTTVDEVEPGEDEATSFVAKPV